MFTGTKDVSYICSMLHTYIANLFTGLQHVYITYSVSRYTVSHITACRLCSTASTCIARDA